MKNKQKLILERESLIKQVLKQRQAKNTRMNKITGWLFAGCIFLLGFLTGLILF